MRLIRNPLTYLLTGFSLFIYVPFIFSGLLLFLALDASITGQSVGALIALAAMFLIIFLIAGVYVQSLLFSYAQQSSRAGIIEVFSGARQQFLRILGLDAVIFALLAPVIGLWLAISAPWTSTVLVAWSLIVAFAFLFTPRYIHNHTIWESFKKSLSLWNKHTVRRYSIVTGLAVLATLASLAMAFGALGSMSGAQSTVFFFANVSTVLLGVSSFFPALLVTGWGGSLGVLLLERVFTVFVVIVMLHVVCSKARKSD